MGAAFLNVSKEVGQSESAFVYRLPTSRVKELQQKVQAKTQEFESEYEERCEDHRMSCGMDELEAEIAKALESSPTAKHPGDITTSASINLGANFGASFLQTRSASVFSLNNGSASRPRRMHTQWFGLRWFTPERESTFCAHATLAAAHALYETARLQQSESTRHVVDAVPGEFFIPSNTDVLCFVTPSGVVSVRRKEKVLPTNAGSGVFEATHVNLNAVDEYEIHFPSEEAINVTSLFPKDAKARLAEVIGLPYGEESIDEIALSPKLGTYVLQLPSAKYVLQCQPDHIKMINFFKSTDIQEVIAANPKKLVQPHCLAVTAENNGELMTRPMADAQVVSRSFSPWDGTLEDCASGSLHCAIVPYWLRKRNGSYKVGERLYCYQASKRGGFVEGIIIGRKAERIALIGSAVTFLRGTSIFNVEE
ncbi:Phenazine biosynthesis-like protein, putative [Angomonas deanei]|uniref:Phenazine biosynthesis-like protein, putative n=1 Tax=Angomonas deanei TaxID=59799 RepID=A0A7G2CRW9_9TRYP|nr:Phenazine biosynthesis-like protein, putative [Angomonas deanei]